MQIIDISQELFSAPVYPGDPEPKLQRISRIELGDSCNLSAIYACLHNGTHADAPLHFIEDAQAIDEVPLEKFIGPCKVIEVDKGPITGAYVERFFPRNCKRLLVKSKGKAWLMGNAADEVAQLGIELYGTDSQSIGTSGAQREPHTSLLGNNIAILEGLDLSKVVTGDYFLFAPPLKIAGSDGSPVRAVLISGYIFWSGK